MIPLIRAILIMLGTVSLFVGITGIFIPGLPTTPFLLLTAGLYLRSSEKLYRMLITSRYAGPYISEFQATGGMPVRLKLVSVALMWVMIIISIIFFINSPWLKLVIIACGITGSVVMGLLVPTTGKK